MTTMLRAVSLLALVAVSHWNKACATKPPPSTDDIATALNNATEARDAQVLADEATVANTQPDENCGAFKAVQYFNKYCPEAMNISQEGFIIRSVLTELNPKFNCEGDEINHHLSTVATSKQFKCPYVEPKCDTTAVYRTIDGTCNNLNNPLWGAASTPMTRFLEPEYEDEVSALKTKGGALPNPRLVSSTVTLPGVIPDNVHVNMVMQWGQFVDHDITLTPVTELAANAAVDRAIPCGKNGCNRNSHDACEPIDVPENDPFFTQDCLPFVRSLQVPNLECTTGPMSLLNAITAYIDGSAVYGSSLELMEELRDTVSTRGRMAVYDNNGDELLPLESKKACEGALSTMPCFKAGDSRANVQNCLTSMHTLWVREHNRIEGQLYALHPEWSGEVLFQESRKILGALLQLITYNEFLPAVLGTQKMTDLNINTLESGYSNNYDDTVDASIRQGFASAAYRFGHSLIPEMLHRLDSTYTSDPDLEVHLSSVFFNTDALFATSYKGVDGFLRGMVGQDMSATDNTFAEAITEHLFTESPPHGPGSDMVALNIQRGRDHGLPGYLSYRRYCGLSAATGFDDLADIPADVAYRLASLYKDVEHIDLFIAAVSEEKLDGAIVGPTLSCLLGEQFTFLKNGDRFWHENEGIFTDAQLQEIRKVTLSRVICDNSGIDDVPQHAFLKMNEVYDSADGYPYNPLVNCEKLPALDFSAWA